MMPNCGFWVGRTETPPCNCTIVLAHPAIFCCPKWPHVYHMPQIGHPFASQERRTYHGDSQNKKCQHFGRSPTHSLQCLGYGLGFHLEGNWSVIMLAIQFFQVCSPKLSLVTISIAHSTALKFGQNFESFQLHCMQCFRDSSPIFSTITAQMLTPFFPQSIALHLSHLCNLMYGKGHVLQTLNLVLQRICTIRGMPYRAHQTFRD